MVRDKSKLPISIQENKKVKLMVCDIRESSRYEEEISQINYLIHTATAWGNPRRAYEVNIKAFEELLEMRDIEKLEKIIYFSSASILDTQTELMRESLIYGTLLAMPWALKSRKHIQINLVINKLSKPYKKIINILILIILIIFSSYVMIFGFDIFYDSFVRGRTTGSLLNLPSWIAELSIPFCFLLLLIQSFLEIIKLLKNIEPPESNH